MKTNLRSLLMACGVVVFSGAADAYSQNTGFYIRGDAGGVITEETDLKQFFGPVLPNSRVEFDPGARFAVAGGYRVTDWFAVEFETGAMTQEIDFITGATRIDEVTFSNVPMLVNLRLQCPSNWRLVPYLGGGAGGSISVISADRLTINGTTLDGSDGTAVFAYHAFGGMRFRLNDRMGLSLEYHYFGTTSPEWEAESTFGTFSDKMEFGKIQSHTVSIAFDWAF